VVWSSKPSKSDPKHLQQCKSTPSCPSPLAPFYEWFCITAGFSYYIIQIIEKLLKEFQNVNCDLCCPLEPRYTSEKLTLSPII
jgi:hypothetical protein